MCFVFLVFLETAHSVELKKFVGGRDSGQILRDSLSCSGVFEFRFVRFDLVRLWFWSVLPEMIGFSAGGKIFGVGDSGQIWGDSVSSYGVLTCRFAKYDCC